MVKNRLCAVEVRARAYKQTNKQNVKEKKKNKIKQKKKGTRNPVYEYVMFVCILKEHHDATESSGGDNGVKKYYCNFSFE